MTRTFLVLATAGPGKPAGAAALGEVLLATGIAGVLSATLLLLGWAHRTRRTTVLTRAADAAGRILSLPGWAALPTVVVTPSLLTALLGMYWDISLHIDQGRDPGPLANPAHYLILFGLFGVFAAGALTVALPLDERPGRHCVQLTRTWHAPVGGLLIAAAGLYALLGFPLDDVWHRLFGQDVTLWGPTHLMLIGGAGLSLVGVVVLEQEGRAAHTGGATASRRASFLTRSYAMGGLLIGLSTYQGEFDFGVPQFRLVNQPLLIAAAAGVALVAARLWIGRGGALMTAVFFLVVRGLIAAIVGGVFGETTPSFPLYLGSAVLVESLALAFAARPLLFGAGSGVLIGTAGTAVEGVWTPVVNRLPWTTDMLVEGALLAVTAGVAGGLLGALLGSGLTGRLPRPRLSALVAAASVIAIGLAVADALVISVPHGVQAGFTLTDAEPHGGVRYVNATVTLPASAVDDPSWLQITAWQGGGMVVERLHQTAPGTWRTTSPVPVSGDWKTLLRLHDGRNLASAPVYLPEDRAIPAPAVLADAHFTRTLGRETQVLQRERKQGVAGWLWLVASLTVLSCSLLLVAALAWGVRRMSQEVAEQGGDPRRPGRRTPGLPRLREAT